MTQSPTTPPQLVALKAISNGALAAEKLPAKIKVLNWGNNETTKGAVILDLISATALPVNQRKQGFERVAIDFEHNTVPGSPEFERSHEPRRVAGYGTPSLIQNDGLYLEDVEWTPAGQAEAKNFADLSPAVQLDSQRRVSLLHSVALCRNGAVYDLSFYSQQGAPPVVFLAAALILDSISHPGPYAPPEELDAFYKAVGANDPISYGDVAELIGLGRNASRASVGTRLKDLMRHRCDCLTADGFRNRVLVFGLTTAVEQREPKGRARIRMALLAEGAIRGITPLSAGENPDEPITYKGLMKSLGLDPASAENKGRFNGVKAADLLWNELGGDDPKFSVADFAQLLGLPSSCGRVEVEARLQELAGAVKQTFSVETHGSRSAYVLAQAITLGVAEMAAPRHGLHGLARAIWAHEKDPG